MKKVLAVILVLVMVLSMFCLSGCGSKAASDPYQAVKDWSAYVTLPDYMTYTVTDPSVIITNDDVEMEIASRLSAASTETNDITIGKVDKGDAVTISFYGTLEDGSTIDGMNSDSYDLTLGAASMIDGFQEGIYGKEIGIPFVLHLQFPDPYSNNPDLSGKYVDFEITVLAKHEQVIPDYNEEFIQTDSKGNCSTDAEYRDYIKQILTARETDSQLETYRNDYYNSVRRDAEITELLPEAVEYEKSIVLSKYESYAADSNMELEQFVKESMGYTMDDFNDLVNNYVDTTVTQKMIIYAWAAELGAEVSDKEYKAELQSILSDSGVDEDTFKQYYGVSIEEYAESYNIRIGLVLEKILDAVWDQLPRA